MPAWAGFNLPRDNGRLSIHCFRTRLAPVALAPTTVWRRLKRWGEEGVWERIWRIVLAALDRQGQLDWTMSFLDGSFAPAKRGGDNVGLTRKGKGTKWMLVIDANGLPLSFSLGQRRVCRSQARRTDPGHDFRHARPEDGHDSDRRKWSLIVGMIVGIFALHCDAAAFGCAFRPNGGQPHGEPNGAGQWSCARRIMVYAIAWSGVSPSFRNFRRLLIRWEYLFSVYRSMFTVAVLLLCHRHLAPIA
jgi:hypothetical protein